VGVPPPPLAGSGLRVARSRDQRQRELHVRLDLVGVEGALEEAELRRASEVVRIEVDAVVPRVVVPVRLPDEAAVPSPVEVLRGHPPRTVDALDEALVDRAAVATEPRLLNPERVLDQALVLVDHLHQICERARGDAARSDMDVDRRAGVDLAPRVRQGADDLHQVAHVLVAEDGADDLAVHGAGEAPVAHHSPRTPLRVDDARVPAIESATQRRRNRLCHRRPAHAHGLDLNSECKRLHCRLPRG
jgi:hypothetical protein